MSAALASTPFAFTVDRAHEAAEPPEERGIARDQVHMLVSEGERDPTPTTFAELPRFLRPGDLLVVNTSATVPAAVDGRLADGSPVVLHYSGELPGGVTLVEVRTPWRGTTTPRHLAAPARVTLPAGVRAELLTPFAGSRRLWIARLDGVDGAVDYLARHGRPIRYRHVRRDWPIESYRTVFGRTPGSAEMPSASRPFTDRLVTRLVRAGIGIAPVLLHTGVSSLEGDEAPYPEQYVVPTGTATAVNAVHGAGGRIVAVGTTVVRALATTTDEHGVVHPGRGWTEVFVDADHPVGSVDGLLTGWHEPESTHLEMLRALAPTAVLTAAYRAAIELGYLWHEFGDSHLIVAEART